MFQVSISSYMNGLFDMASGISKSLGPSGISVFGFAKKDFIKHFKKFFGIKGDIELVDSSDTFDSILFDWFKDGAVVSELLYLMISELGDINRILVSSDDTYLRDELCSESGGLSGFYFVEDVYFVEFHDYMICFIIGNNE